MKSNSRERERERERDRDRDRDRERERETHTQRQRERDRERDRERERELIKGIARSFGGCVNVVAYLAVLWFTSLNRINMQPVVYIHLARFHQADLF